MVEKKRSMFDIDKRAVGEQGEQNRWARVEGVSRL
jgi:hypothetical protein